MTTITFARLPTDFIDIPDYHEAVDRLKLVNRGSGFGITIQRTKTDKTALRQTRKVYLQCYKSRPYKSTSTGVRKVTSKSTECPWRAALTREDHGWRVEVTATEHNHELDGGSPPAPTPARRQKPKAPLRAFAALDPYPSPATPELPHPSAPPSHVPSVTPRPFAGPSQFPTMMSRFHAGQFNTGMPQFPSTTPPGSPHQFQRQPQAQVQAPDQSQVQAQAQTLSRSQLRPQAQADAPQSSSGPRRLRRGGYSIMSEIKRVEVPLDQRLVSTARKTFVVEPPAFVVYNDEFNHVLGDNPNLVIAYEDNFPFAHGAAIFSPQRDIVFVTSSQFVPQGRHDRNVIVSRLTRKPDESWTRHEVLTVAVLTNGGTNFKDGLLFCAQGDYRDSGGLVHMEADYPFRTTVVLNNYLGRRFNSVNDVVVHTDGSIWFTDPIYGFEQGQRPKPDLPNQAYRFDPQSGDVRVVADGFGRPKGICFSPDEMTVYITDTDSVHGDGSRDPTRASTIYAFDIMEKHTTKWLTNRRVFAMPDVGVPDGIQCDMQGNVYAGCGDGLNVWNAGGVLLGKVLVPGGVPNFCFGRSGELFLLNESRFWILTVAKTVKGALLERMGVQVDPPARDDSVDSMESFF